MAASALAIATMLAGSDVKTSSPQPHASVASTATAAALPAAPCVVDTKSPEKAGAAAVFKEKDTSQAFTLMPLLFGNTAQPFEDLISRCITNARNVAPAKSAMHSYRRVVLSADESSEPKPSPQKPDGDAKQPPATKKNKEFAFATLLSHAAEKLRWKPPSEFLKTSHLLTNVSHDKETEVRLGPQDAAEVIVSTQRVCRKKTPKETEGVVQALINKVIHSYPNATIIQFDLEPDEVKVDLRGLSRLHSVIATAKRPIRTETEGDGGEITILYPKSVRTAVLLSEKQPDGDEYPFSSKCISSLPVGSSLYVSSNTIWCPYEGLAVFAGGKLDTLRVVQVDDHPAGQWLDEALELGCVRGDLISDHRSGESKGATVRWCDRKTSGNAPKTLSPMSIDLRRDKAASIAFVVSKAFKTMNFRPLVQISLRLDGLCVNWGVSSAEFFDTVFLQELPVLRSVETHTADVYACDHADGDANDDLPRPDAEKNKTCATGTAPFRLLGLLMRIISSPREYATLAWRCHFDVGRSRNGFEAALRRLLTPPATERVSDMFKHHKSCGNMDLCDYLVFYDVLCLYGKQSSRPSVEPVEKTSHAFLSRALLALKRGETNEHAPEAIDMAINYMTGALDPVKEFTTSFEKATKTATITHKKTKNTLTVYLLSR